MRQTSYFDSSIQAWPPATNFQFSSHFCRRKFGQGGFDLGRFPVETLQQRFAGCGNVGLVLVFRGNSSLSVVSVEIAHSPAVSATCPANRPKAHGFGVGFQGEIGVGRDRLEHLARLGGLAVVFGNQFFLKIHRATSYVAKPAYRIPDEKRRKSDKFIAIFCPQAPRSRLLRIARQALPLLRAMARAQSPAGFPCCMRGARRFPARFQARGGTPRAPVLAPPPPPARNIRASFHFTYVSNGVRFSEAHAKRAWARWHPRSLLHLTARPLIRRPPDCCHAWFCLHRSTNGILGKQTFPDRWSQLNFAVKGLSA